MFRRQGMHVKMEVSMELYILIPRKECAVCGSVFHRVPDAGGGEWVSICDLTWGLCL